MSELKRTSPEKAADNQKLSSFLSSIRPLESISPTQRKKFTEKVNNCMSKRELQTTESELENIKIGRGNAYTEKGKTRRQFLQTVSEQLEYVTFSEIKNWQVPREEIEKLFDYDLPIRDSEQTDYIQWEKFVSQHSLSELTFVCEALEKYYSQTNPDKQPRNRRQFIRGVLSTYPQTDIQPDEVITVSDKGDGYDADLVKKSLNQIFRLLNPIWGGMLATWLSKITTNNTKKVTSRSYEQTYHDGWYSHYNNKINVRDEVTLPESWDAQSRTSKKWTYSESTRPRLSFVLAHEIGHSLHHVFGIDFPVERLGAKYGPKEEWKWEPSQSFNPTKKSEQFKTDFRDVWESWVNNGCEPLIRKRQKYTPAEFIASGFEAFILNPTVVQEKMPALANLFEDYFVVDIETKREKQ